MNFTDFEYVLKEKFPDINDRKIEKFKQMEPLYKDWNAKINVISRKDIDMLYLHHVAHSLAIAEFFRINFPGMYDAMSAEAPQGDGKPAACILSGNPAGDNVSVSAFHTVRFNRKKNNRSGRNSRIARSFQRTYRQRKGGINPGKIRLYRIAGCHFPGQIHAVGKGKIHPGHRIS